MKDKRLLKKRMWMWNVETEKLTPGLMDAVSCVLAARGRESDKELDEELMNFANSGYRVIAFEDEIEWDPEFEDIVIWDMGREIAEDITSIYIRSNEYPYLSVPVGCTCLTLEDIDEVIAEDPTLIFPELDVNWMGNEEDLECYMATHILDLLHITRKAS